MTIDVHTHFYPRLYIDRLKAERGIPRVEVRNGREFFVAFASEAGNASPMRGRPIDQSYYEITEKLIWMDQHGIQHSIISLGNPWFEILTAAEAPMFAMRVNDIFLELARQHPGRLSWYGALPVQHLPSALDEVERIARAGARGVILSTRPGGVFLDDRSLWPLFERLQALRLPILIHPHYTLGDEALHGYDHGLPLVFGFPFETTLAVARLILSGALDAFPTLRVIVAHLGGTLPYLAGRFDVWHSSVGGGILREPPSRYLARLYYDALVYHRAALACGVEVAGVGHVMFGSDHPFAIADVAAVRASLAAHRLTSEDYVKIDRGNAIELFRIEP